MPDDLTLDEESGAVRVLGTAPRAASADLGNQCAGFVRGVGDFLSSARPCLEAVRRMEAQLMACKARALGVRQRLLLEERDRLTRRREVQNEVAAKQRELEALRKAHAALRTVQMGQQRVLDKLTGGGGESAALSGLGGGGSGGGGGLGARMMSK